MTAALPIQLVEAQQEALLYLLPPLHLAVAAGKVAYMSKWQ
jgi:hypothetical protein